MSFFVPGALALAVLALPIILFYMLKLRRREVVVSSTMLWQRLLRDREANSPWQRLRRNLLLLLQLLILALLVLALARPYRRVAAVARGNVVLVLDASASMGATDVAPTRFAAAQDVARGLIDGLGADEVMTIIAAGPSPHVLASTTGDKTALRRALAAAQATNGQADWQAALTLAAASAQVTPRSTVVIVSDGGLPPDLPGLPVPVTYVPVGRGSDNRAILALAVRDGAQGPQVFVRVANFGAAEATALVELEVDGQLFDARQLTLSPRDEQGLTFTGLPLDARQVTARLSGGDALAVDDVAWAVHAASQPARVLLYSPGNVFLERALGLLPNVEVWKEPSNLSTFQPSNSPTFQPSITVLDGLLPEPLPPDNLLIVNPPHSTELFTVGEVFTATQVIRVESGDPLLRYVVLRDVHVARARFVTPPGWMRVLVQAEGGPLLLAGEREGRRVAVLTFDLHASDLPLKIAFPILMSNLVGWLAPSGGMEMPATLRPGDPLTLHPAVDATQLVIESPSGRRWTYPAAGEPIPFAETTELGIYTVHQSVSSAKSADSASSAQSAEQVDHFAVNLFSAMESDITPREVITVGAQQIAVPQEGLQSRQEWWRWPALAAVIVLLVEWWVHWRGGRLLY